LIRRRFRNSEQIIALLDLKPHPEGGYFKETFRDSIVASSAQRAASTAIYFLLPAGQISAWHKVDAAEAWHFYAGAPLELSIIESGEKSAHILGVGLLNGERPQKIVPAHAWQQARSLGDYTLAGCTVAPGFTFDGFELAKPGFDPAGL
jgi:uncharacterized protein